MSETRESLITENNMLREKISKLKEDLIKAEILNGLRQVPIMDAPCNNGAITTSAVASNITEADGDKPKPVKAKKEKTKTAAATVDGGTGDSSYRVDVSRLNMRIGRIVSIKPHPDADNLYVETVDLGEAEPRTVVSGLVKHMPVEQLQNRIAIFMCNLKPAKMRGIVSQAMIMCASSPEKVEVIDPPADVQIGDRVLVDGFPGEPDEELNPKKKIWEQVQPDLRIDSNGIATYKGAPWNVAGKGPCTAATARDSAIK